MVGKPIAGGSDRKRTQGKKKSAPQLGSRLSASRANRGGLAATVRWKVVYQTGNRVVEGLSPSGPWLGGSNRHKKTCTGGRSRVGNISALVQNHNRHVTSFYPILAFFNCFQLFILLHSVTTHCNASNAPQKQQPRTKQQINHSQPASKEVCPSGHPPPAQQLAALPLPISTALIFLFFLVYRWYAARDDTRKFN